jgi:hypothetical protein
MPKIVGLAARTRQLIAAGLVIAAIAGAVAVPRLERRAAYVPETECARAA